MTWICYVLLSDLQIYFYCYKSLCLLSALTFSVLTPQNGQTYSNDSSNWLSVFYHFVGLALKGLNFHIIKVSFQWHQKFRSTQVVSNQDDFLDGIFALQTSRNYFQYRNYQPIQKIFMERVCYEQVSKHSEQLRKRVLLEFCEIRQKRCYS